MPVNYFYSNTGGVNLSASPLAVRDDQATGGYNYDYTKAGAISKSRGRLKVNSAADTQLKSLGLAVHNTATGTKTLVRCAGTKIQTVNLDLGTFSNVSEDTAVANSDFLLSGSTQPVVAVNFNTATANLLWLAGGGMSGLYAFDGTKITKNGADAPTGTITPSVGGTSGSWTTTGTYYYALALRKTETRALSLAALDASAVIAASNQAATITFPAVDATKYDQWYVYRSAVGGASGFTTGTLVAQVSTGTASYVDNGNVSVATAQVVPRAGGTTDNSVLPSGTYKYVTAFKRRLVTAKGSTFYLSDLDKPESWPTANNFTIPTGGDITAIGVIGYNSPVSSNTDEYLVICKETETWVFTGNNSSDWELNYVDAVGCAGQSLMVAANGFLAWVDYRGVYMWDGKGKPIYTSVPIESLFGFDGDIDKSKLTYGWGRLCRSKNQIIWHVPHRVYGENAFFIKLDVRLTIPRFSQNLTQTIADGVFTLGTGTNMYAGVAYSPEATHDELFIAGDASGYIYKMFYDINDDGAGVDFSYDSKFLDMGVPDRAKRFKKVIARVDDLVSSKLTLEYWADYRTQDNDASQVSEVMSSGKKATPSLFDVAVFDEAYFDEYTPGTHAVVFNLSGEENNNEGDCIKLRFSQSDTNVPVTLLGFSVVWEDLSSRK